MTLRALTWGKEPIYYVQKSYRKEDGKNATKNVERLGTLADLKARFGEEDPIGAAKKYIVELTAAEKEANKKVLVEYSPTTLITKGEQRCYNGGYLFLQKIYYELGLDYICKKIAKKHKSLNNPSASWSRCTGRFLCWRRSSTRSRRTCTSAASSWGSATPAWCTTT